MLMFVRYTAWAGWSISSNFGHDRQYMGYSKKEAIKMYRELYGVKGKRIKIIEE